MKKNRTLKILSSAWSATIACLTVMVLVAGCGSGAITSSDAGSGGGLIIAGVGTGGTGVVTTSGADTYIKPVLVNAIVFLDKNGNRLPDPGEPSAITDANGDYTTLQLDPAEAAAYPLLMQAVAGTTMVKATGQLITENYVIELKR